MRAALRDPQETMTHIVRVDVVSRDCARWVDGDGEGALAGARACTWNVDRRDLAFLSPHVTVIHVICVSVVSNYCACWVAGWR